MNFLATTKFEMNIELYWGQQIEDIKSDSFCKQLLCIIRQTIYVEL